MLKVAYIVITEEIEISHLWRLLKHGTAEWRNDGKKLKYGTTWNTRNITKSAEQ